MIKSEFILEFMADSLNLLHLSLLLFVRGFNLSIFNHFFLGQQFYQYFIKIKRDIAKQVQFREFMDRLERDFPLIQFEITQSNQS